MAHSKCLHCKARVWRDGPAADHADDLCPGCGGPLEAVGDLSELVGLRALRVRPRPAHWPRWDVSARISEQIRETVARNDRIASELRASSLPSPDPGGTP
jgi:hypothetical protein